MPKPPAPEKSVLFLNNLAGDDLWEYSHLMLPEYQRFSAPQELLKYKNTAREKYNSDGVYVTSMPYMLSGYGEIQLYGFPFLPFDIDPFDLEYPIPVYGLVITEDMRMFDYFIEEDPHFSNIADPRFSRLAWTKTQSLPTVLAVHHAKDHMGDLQKLSRLVGMEIFCPVIWHDAELNAHFLRKAVETVFSEIRQI